MEENELFLYVIQEMLLFDEENIFNDSLYERNPIKTVISDKGKNELVNCKYKDVINKEKYTFCCITRDEFKDDDDVVQLPCEHCFSPDAILKWLSEESCSCPICKTVLDSVEIKEKENQSDDTFFLSNSYGMNNVLNQNFIQNTIYSYPFLYSDSFYNIPPILDDEDDMSVD